MFTAIGWQLIICIDKFFRRNVKELIEKKLIRKMVCQEPGFLKDQILRKPEFIKVELEKERTLHPHQLAAPRVAKRGPSNRYSGSKGNARATDVKGTGERDVAVFPAL